MSCSLWSESLTAGSSHPSGERRIRPYLPALLLALVSLWTGTFLGAASAIGATLTQVAILALCVFGFRDWRDPLGLGPRCRWLVPVLLAAMLLSWWQSPVPRAGRTSLILIPALILLPAAVAECWSTRRGSRSGRAALSLVVAVVAGISLIARFALGHSRAAFPLGHHTLLAGWLVLLLPLVLGSELDSRGQRWLAGAAGVTGILALIFTGSLLGGAVAVVQLILAANWFAWSWRRIAMILMVAAIVLTPRSGRVLTGLDSSIRARAVYLDAGVAGIAQRPIVGWGPGATPWTIAEFTAPVSGLNPSSEIIGDLHSLPVQIAYELGLPALVLLAALSICFLVARSRERQISACLRLRKASLLGLIGAALFSLGAAPVSIPALPFAAAMVAGASLSTRSSRPARAIHLESVALPTVYLIAAAVCLIPSTVAHFLYDLARHEPDKARAQERIESAAALDTGFPLYLARAAWLAADEATDARSAERALQAARQARGLAPLWLEAGFLGHRMGAPWAVEALETAARLDPLSTLIAFHVMVAQPESPDAAQWGARALMGEPGFAQALFWRSHPSLAEAVAARAGIRPHTSPLAASSRIAPFAMIVDKRPTLSFSVFAFRRSPWPGALAPVELVVVPETGP